MTKVCSHLQALVTLRTKRWHNHGGTTHNIDDSTGTPVEPLRRDKMLPVHVLHPPRDFVAPRGPQVRGGRDAFEHAEPRRKAPANRA